MHYIGEHQMGYHSLALGFPSIDGCHAICLQTKAGLFGIHVLGRVDFDDRMEKEAQAFASFVQNHNQGQDFLHLYGTCFQKKRGWSPPMEDRFKSWKKEIKVYAKKLGYKGRISHFDLSTLANWPPKPNSKENETDSAYVEYRRVFSEVTILAKPWSQCGHDNVKANSVEDTVNFQFAKNNGTATVCDKYSNNTCTYVNSKGSGFQITPAAIRQSFKY